ncbi:PRMT5 arginine-N-methyltransferase-domain-containing protein [Globomyces pollinis-pini]|nr:PRMT5 arginine-N-methyltransferase-domain-containing protein [Globomyces pollinis-pini]
MEVGLEVLCCSSVDELIGNAKDHHYDFVLANILHMENGHFLTDNAPIPASLPSDSLFVHQLEHVHSIFGMISIWTDLDSSDLIIRQKSELLVKKQIDWAVHIGLRSIMFTLPLNGSIYNLARVISSRLDTLRYSTLTIRIPIDRWNDWNTIRMFCQHSSKLGVTLELTGDNTSQDIMDRWIAEPIRNLIIPTNVFLKNKKGFPALSKSHQQFYFKLIKSNPKVIVSNSDYNARHPSATLISYRQYIDHLFQNQPEPDIIDQFATGYHDYLQTPLQPLMDNLESATYEVFEKDPVKYNLYETAIYRALIDRAPLNSTQPTVIMVVGAGRGPLVDRALKASQSSKRPVKVYAIEKNPNAIITLRKKKTTEWHDRVQVVHTDMRFWTPPEKVIDSPNHQCDILVSELLGSFGDNELSPECLDGAQKVLKNTGISIPQNYTAFVAPLSSTRLYNNAKQYNDVKYLETGFVVKFRDVYEINTSKPVWTFTHPNPISMVPLGHPDFNHHNTRYSKTMFDIHQSTTMHGIAAYFESILYKDVIMSINPITHSPQMTSWFPMYFPIKNPIYLPKDSKIEFHFWRLTDQRKVWYEWCVVPIIDGQVVVSDASHIHNRGGKSSWIGL